MTKKQKIAQAFMLNNQIADLKAAVHFLKEGVVDPKDLPVFAINSVITELQKLAEAD